MFQLITVTPRVKNVTPPCISPPLWPSCTSHHAVLSLHATYPFILPANPHLLCPTDLLTTSLCYLTPPLCWSFPSTLLCLSLSLYHNPPFLLCFHPLRPPPPFSLSVCNDRVCRSRIDCVNVKPFAAMIMFITHCVSRCPWINTNWRSTLQCGELKDNCSWTLRVFQHYVCASICHMCVNVIHTLSAGGLCYEVTMCYTVLCLQVLWS